MVTATTEIKRKLPTPSDSRDFPKSVADSARRFYAYQHPRQNRSVSLGDRELPSQYNNTQVTLLARDPHYIHAHWEIAPQTKAEIRKNIGSQYDRATYTLRLYDVTKVNFNGNNANHSFDVDLPPHSNNWYVNLWGDNVAYCGEIGVRTPQGQFHPVARSNVVATPRASSSGRSDMIWMDVKENRKDTFLYSRQRAKRIEQAMAKAGTRLPIHTQPGRKVYLSENDVRAYYSNLFPLLKKLKRFKRNNGNNGDNGDNGKNFSKAKDINKFTNREQIGDVYIPGISKSEYYRKFLLGASAELLKREGASEKNFVGASESKSDVSKRRKFFFEIWTELIVYGRTEPDAKVYLGGGNVPLRKDGTFTLRYALPDGRIPFDFVAISHDQVDQRTISTAVERARTLYGP